VIKRGGGGGPNARTGKEGKGGGPKPTFILTADENAPNLSLPVEQTNGKEGSEKRDEEGRGGKGGGEE